MAIVEIPVRNDFDRYSLIVALDGTDYRLSFAYNTRDDHWYLSVELTDGTELASGIPIVADTPLLGRWSYKDDIPSGGFLMAVDTTGESADPVKDDLGDRLRLMWVPLEDID